MIIWSKSFAIRSLARFAACVSVVAYGAAQVFASDHATTAVSLMSFDSNGFHLSDQASGSVESHSAASKGFESPLEHGSVSVRFVDAFRYDDGVAPAVMFESDSLAIVPVVNSLFTGAQTSGDWQDTFSVKIAPPSTPVTATVLLDVNLLPGTTGYYVSTVSIGLPGFRAALKPTDVAIFAYGGKPIFEYPLSFTPDLSVTSHLQVSISAPVDPATGIATIPLSAHYSSTVFLDHNQIADAILQSAAIVGVHSVSFDAPIENFEFTADSGLDYFADPTVGCAVCGIALAQPLYGDYNEDGTVDTHDYAAWRSKYGTSDFATDVNRDNIIDGADYVIWRKNSVANGNGSMAAVPEPATAMAALLILLASMRCTRRQFAG
jgi:hypothetical protein